MAGIVYHYIQSLEVLQVGSHILEIELYYSLTTLHPYLRLSLLTITLFSRFASEER